MRRLLALESEGCEMFVLPVDLAREARVRSAVERCAERFGAIDGAVFYAGPSAASLVQWQTKEAAVAVLAPRVRGALAVAEALDALPRPPAFLALCGANASGTWKSGWST